jgi:hypothetical protein
VSRCGVAKCDVLLNIERANRAANMYLAQDRLIASCSTGGHDHLSLPFLCRESRSYRGRIAAGIDGARLCSEVMQRIR